MTEEQRDLRMTQNLTRAELLARLKPNLGKAFIIVGARPSKPER
jgi:hypothetical protein